MDRADFALEPCIASRHLALRRRLVNAALSTRFPAEMLDRIGQVEIGRRDAGFAQQPPQQLAGWTDEGLSLLILVVTRLLADEHQSRLAGAFAADPLRCTLPEIAAAAGVDLAFDGRLIGRIACHKIGCVYRSSIHIAGRPQMPAEPLARMIAKLGRKRFGSGRQRAVSFL